MSQKISKYQFYFDDPRLRMTIAGRIVVRVVSYISYLVLAVATFVCLLSYDIRSLFYLGVFLLLVVADLFFHRGQGDMPISEMVREPQGAKVNLAEVMDGAAFNVLERAVDRSVIMKNSFLLELTSRLFDLPQIEDGLRRLDVNPKEFKAKLEALMEEPAAPENYLSMVEPLAIHAFSSAVSAGHDFIKPADFFSALPAMGNERLDRLFLLFNIEEGDLERALIFSALAAGRGFFGRLPSALGGFAMETHHVVQHRIMNRAWTSRPTPTLDKYGMDLTDMARDSQVGFLIGHEAEYERLVETLARPINPNALLIGEPGIGKEAIIKHLAFCMVKDDVPEGLFDKRLVGLQLQSLIAGAPPEELDARLKLIVEEIYAAGNIILYIPDIHNLVRTSGTAYLSAADALMPLMSANNIPIVGTSYPKEFKQFIEPRSDFSGVFESIMINEISEADAQKVLTYESFLLERQSRIEVSFGAIKRAVLLAKKYLRSKYLPSSAEELLKSAIVDAERRGEKVVTPDRVTAVAEEKVNIPMHEAEGDEAAKLLNMEVLIHEHIVGQDEAVGAVAQALREYRSGLTRKGGPIASFLFVGPTGVGKTELAKILTEIQFGSEKMMVRFDMTEYQDKTSFYRFIGSPDGTVRGALTDAVIEKPYGLVLLDEFEKAYPDILNLFLQVLDDGRLTDNMGRVVDFTNTIIIATSNAHSDIINEALAKGESMTDIAEYLKARLVDVLKPELLNRFSKIIIFKSLDAGELPKIAQINVNELCAAVREQGITLSFSPEAIARIAKLGYDPAFGARPLRRVIDEHIRAPLSEALLAKKIIKGARVECVVKDDAFDFVNQ
jgi:ATP-dependent Clp protease ATP-binding subunit ClpC